MSQTRVLPLSFHPLGLVAISVVSCALVVWRFSEGDWSPTQFLVALIWVALWMTLQLILDYRRTESWLLKMTTPPFGLTPRELVEFRWPFMVCVLLGIPLGFTLVMGLTFAYLIIYYRWQRRLYVRSRREFDSLATRQAALR